MSGGLRVRSKPGRGTLFVLDLPMDPSGESLAGQRITPFCGPLRGRVDGQTRSSDRERRDLENRGQASAVAITRLAPR